MAGIRTAALHEACHAVVDHEFGITVEAVKLYPVPVTETDGTYDGIFGKKKRVRNKNIRRALACAVAGCYGNFLDEGEKRISDDVCEGWIYRWKYEKQLTLNLMKSWSRDEQISVNLALILRCPVIASIRRAELRASHILQRRWRRVMFLTDELMRCGTLEGDFLYTILHSI